MRLKSKKIYVLASLLVLGLFSAPAWATLLTFDDINANADVQTIANGYDGFNWSNFGVISYDYANLNNWQGYIASIVSGPNVAVNLNGDYASMSLTGGTTFNLISGYFTGANSANNTLIVQGYTNGVLEGTSSTLLSNTSPTFISFNFTGIDTVWFSSSLGAYNNGQVAMDNITVNVVPEPSTFPLLLLGGSAVLLLRPRRTSKKPLI